MSLGLIEAESRGIWSRKRSPKKPVMKKKEVSRFVEENHPPYPVPKIYKYSSNKDENKNIK